MKPEKASVPGLSRLELISRILAIIVIILALSLIGGTIHTLMFRDKKEKPENAVVESKSNETLSSPSELDGIFTGIGRIRASTTAPETATVILSIAFPYLSTDKAFSRELAARIGDFRAAAISYFGSFSVEELRQKDEAAVKTELLKQFNDLLRLGQIATLYFSDYMIIE
jgi:flagellar basal body-associated protein FliL